MAEHLHAKAIKVSGHLEEKRGIYQMVLNWTDTEGERHRKSISTKLPVKGNKTRANDMLYEARKKKEQELALMPKAEDILFADFMEQWLDVIRPEIKITTFGGYQMNVRRAIAPWFRKRGILLRNLTAEDINEFYDDCLERIKATSVLKYHANISKALKYAVKKGLIPYSVMNKVDRPKPERFVGKFLKQSEAIALFEAVKGHKLELGVILGAFYGLRRSEVVGLRWESINFEANTITIEHTVTSTTLDGKRVIIADDTTKTKSSVRTLPLVPSIREKLLSIKEEQEFYRNLCGKSYNTKESQYIYTDQLGNRIKPDYLSREFPVFLEKHGFRRMRFHDLRHSCASLLLAAGVPLKQIQEYLGHSDFAITANTYAHLEFNSKIASVNAMTWIGKTSIGAKFSSESEKQEMERSASANDFQTELANAINGLMASGAPVELISEWLQQEDIADAENLHEHFTLFMLRKYESGAKKLPAHASA